MSDVQNFKREQGSERQTEKQTEDVVKITVRREAEEKLAQVLERVNNGFEAGRVNRQELAGWIFTRFAKDCDSEVVKAIRQDHFDEFAMLESLLKKSKEQGQLPSDLKFLLRQHVGMEAPQKRSGKSALTKNYINDVIPKDDGMKGNE